MVAERRALVIGVDKYHNLSPLPCCKNDAMSMYDLLGSKLGYEVFQGKPLISSELPPDTDWMAIRDAINDFFEDAKPSEILVFYFSGHGIPKSDEVYLGTSEVDPRKPLSRGFALSDLARLMGESKSKRIVSIIDCCYSGAATLGEPGVAKANPKAEAAIALATYDRVWDRVPKAEGRYLLLSSQSYDVSYATSEHSIYTKHLLEGLNGVGKKVEGGNVSVHGSVDEEGNITPESLHNYLYDAVGNEADQIPKIKVDASSPIVLASYPALGEKRAQQVMVTSSTQHGPIRPAVEPVVHRFFWVEGYPKDFTKYESGTLYMSPDEFKLLSDVHASLVIAPSSLRGFKVDSSEHGLTVITARHLAAQTEVESRFRLDDNVVNSFIQFVTNQYLVKVEQLHAKTEAKSTHPEEPPRPSRQEISVGAQYIGGYPGHVQKYGGGQLCADPKALRWSRKGTDYLNISGSSLKSIEIDKKGHMSTGVTLGYLIDSVEVKTKLDVENHDLETLLSFVKKVYGVEPELLETDTEAPPAFNPKGMSIHAVLLGGYPETIGHGLSGQLDVQPEGLRFSREGVNNLEIPKSSLKSIEVDKKGFVTTGVTFGFLKGSLQAKAKFDVNSEELEGILGFAKTLYGVEAKRLETKVKV